MRQKGKVLIVDDNAINLAVCEEALSPDYECMCASTGVEALELARVFHPDVVLLDVMMPGIDGYETCERLRADPDLRFAKILLVTAKAQILDRLKGYEAGADDYIVKPFEPDEMVAKVRVFLRLKSVEELDRLKGDMLQLLNHETRTPLTSIMSSLEILRSNYDVVDDSHQWIDIAMKSCERLGSLVEKSAMLSQLRTDRTRIQKRPILFQQLREEALASLGAFIAERELTVNVNVPDDLTVHGDHELLLTLLQSLLDNAIRYSHPRGVVHLHVVCDQDTVILEVKDHGAGIDAKYFPHLFSEFAPSKIDNHSQGHGLSLAVSRTIVERHGGTIHAESIPDQETRFIVRLPIPMSEEEIKRLRSRLVSRTPESTPGRAG